MLLFTFRSDSFIISAYNSLDTETTIKWDSFDPGVLNTDYLKLIEESNPVDLDFLYIIIEEESNSKKKICSIIYFQILRFTKKNIAFNDSFLLNTAAKVIFTLHSFKILVSGNLFAVNFPSIKFDSNILKKVELIRILYEIENRIKPDVFILKDMSNEFIAGEMHDFGWSAYTADLTMTLDINLSWNTLNDYINLLKKKYKRRAEKIVAVGERIKRKEFNADDILNRKKEIKKLFDQVVKKQKVRMGIIGEEYFYLFKLKFPEIFSFYGYFLDAKFIGFSTYIKHNDVLELHYIGIDYNYNKELLIYFNILFDGVEKAIEGHNKQLELGRTAREAKANLGAFPEHFNDYIKTNNRFASFLIKKFSDNFQKEIGDQWTTKHPFR